MRYLTALQHCRKITHSRRTDLATVSTYNMVHFHFFTDKRITKHNKRVLHTYRSANPKDYSDILVLNRNMHQETKVTTRAITVAVSISIQIRHSGACSK